MGRPESARPFQLEPTAAGTRSGNQTGPTENPLLDTVFYTPAVINAPGNIAADIRHARDTLRDLARRPLRMEKEKKLESIHQRDEQHAEKVLHTYDLVDRTDSKAAADLWSSRKRVRRKRMAHRRSDQPHRDRRGGPPADGEFGAGTGHFRCPGNWPDPDWHAGTREAPSAISAVLFAHRFRS